MPTLREVKNRIRTVISTERITRAMEMVAAAKLRRAQEKVEQSRPYSKKMDEMLSQLASGATGEISHPYFEERELKKRTVVVITSDRGLCGSFNSNIIRKANNWLVNNRDVETEIVTIGKRSFDFFKRREWKLIEDFSDWGGSLQLSKAQQVVSFLTERFVGGETDEIVLFYTRFLTMVKYKIVNEKYLPIAPPDTDSVEQTGSNMEYIYEPSPESIYGALMPSYAMTKMITALVESFASEHGSRMMAMGNATKNAGDMIQSLTLDYNKARQAQITKELLEVVSGAEALNA